MKYPYKMIIFLDGECLLCQGLMKFVIYQARHLEDFRFSALQGQYAKEHLPHQFSSELNTVVVKQSNQVLTKAQAVIVILKHMGGFWRLIGVMLGIFPFRAMNWAYNHIARHRYKIFGRKQFCDFKLKEKFHYLILE